MKKIYLFYLYDEKDKMISEIYPCIGGLDVIEGYNFNHVLYAWTPNKNLRKLFKSLRDMAKFREVVHEISNDEFDRFSDENSDTFLEERNITTKEYNSNNTIGKQNVYILSTRRELDTIAYEYVSILRKQLECLVVSDLYLREIYFDEPYRKMLAIFNFDESMGLAYPLEETDAPPFSMYDYDALSIYSHLYQNTYRKDICDL